MRKKNKVLIIIPARGGSKRIKNKNIKFFVDKPLIEHTINYAHKNIDLVSNHSKYRFFKNPKNCK